MAASPYIRTLVGSFNEVYIEPYVGADRTLRPTQIFPAGGLTNDGFWVPWRLNPDGTPILPGQGDPHFDDARAALDPGEVQELVNATVPVGVTRQLMRAWVITRAVGAFHVIVGDGDDEVLVGSGRTGPAGIGQFEWTPARKLAASAIYKVRFLSNVNSPAQDVEAYVQSTDTTP